MYLRLPKDVFYEGDQYTLPGYRETFNIENSQFIQDTACKDVLRQHRNSQPAYNALLDCLIAAELHTHLDCITGIGKQCFQRNSGRMKYSGTISDSAIFFLFANR